MVLVATSDGPASKLEAYHLATPKKGKLERAWSVQLHGDPVGPPIFVRVGADSVVLVAVVDSRTATEGRIVSANLNRKGDNLWPQINNGYGIPVGAGVRPPATFGSRLYVVAGNKFHVYDLRSGAEVHKLVFHRDEQPPVGPCVDDQGHVLLTFLHGAKQNEPQLYVVRE
jgi:hypothetical protein